MAEFKISEMQEMQRELQERYKLKDAYIVKFKRNMNRW